MSVNIHQLLAEKEAEGLNLLDEKLEKIRQNYEAYEKLLRAEYDITFYATMPENQVFYTKKGELTNVKRVLGTPLKKLSVSPVKDDARCKDVKICLTAAAYPGLLIIYNDKLPKGSKCKVVTRTVKRSRLECTL